MTCDVEWIIDIPAHDVKPRGHGAAVMPRSSPAIPSISHDETRNESPRVPSAHYRKASDRRVVQQGQLPDMASAAPAQPKAPSTMEAKVFRIDCLERVEAEKVSALTNVLRKASTTSSAILNGASTIAPITKALKGSQGDDGKTKRDLPVFLRNRTKSSSEPNGTACPKWNWRRVSLEAHMDAAPPRLILTTAGSPPRTVLLSDVDQADILLPSSSITPAEYPHVLQLQSVHVQQEGGPSLRQRKSVIKRTAEVLNARPRSPSAASSDTAGETHANGSGAAHTGKQESLAGLGLLNSKWSKPRQSEEYSTAMSGSTDGARTSTSGEYARTARDLGNLEDVCMAFGSAQSLKAWYALLQALAARSDGCSTEAADVSGRSPASAGGGATAHSSTSSLNSNQGRSTISGWSDYQRRSWSRTAIQGLELSKLDSAEGDSFMCTIHLDDDLVGQTQLAIGNSKIAWSDAFVFDRYEHATRLTLSVRRIEAKSGRAEPYGAVGLTMSQLLGPMGSFSTRDDPVVSSASGIVGHLRLKYRHIALDVNSSPDDLAAWKNLDGPERQSTLESLTTMTGGCEVICRAGLGNQRLGKLLRSLIDLEAKTSSATLFRSNSALTRLLDCAMRLLSTDFVAAAVTPCITRILEGNIELEVDPARSLTGLAGEMQAAGNMRRLDELARKLWDDIYVARDRFPAFLRRVFGYLLKAVQKQHVESNKLQYQCISSFIFLRLLGPAIMWPHMHGLVPAAPGPAIQRTLILLTKPLLNLAFQVEATEMKEAYLAPMGGFLTENKASMADFLVFCSTEIRGAPEYADKQSRSISRLLRERQAQGRGYGRRPGIVLTPAGVVDGAVELALLHAYQKEVLASRVPARTSSSSDGSSSGDNSYSTAVEGSPATSHTTSSMSPKLEPRSARVGIRDGASDSSPLVTRSRALSLAEAISSLPDPEPRQVGAPYIPPRGDSMTPKSPIKGKKGSNAPSSPLSPKRPSAIRRLTSSTMSSPRIGDNPVVLGRVA